MKYSLAGFDNDQYKNAGAKMRIGVPKEIKPQENRIGLTPDSVKTLVSEGHESRKQWRL